MSKLENDDSIFCSNCDARMFDILLCSNKHRLTLEGLPINLRCVAIVCENCKYCHYCRHRYNQLKEELIKNRIGRPDQKPECTLILQRMRDEFNKDWL